MTAPVQTCDMLKLVHVCHQVQPCQIADIKCDWKAPGGSFRHGTNTFSFCQINGKQRISEGGLIFLELEMTCFENKVGMSDSRKLIGPNMYLWDLFSHSSCLVLPQKKKKKAIHIKDRCCSSLVIHTDQTGDTAPHTHCVITHCVLALQKHLSDRSVADKSDVFLLCVSPLSRPPKVEQRCGAMLRCYAVCECWVI